MSDCWCPTNWAHDIQNFSIYHQFDCGDISILWPSKCITGIWICVVPSSLSPQKHKSALLFLITFFYFEISSVSNKVSLDVMRHRCLIDYVEILFRTGSFPPKHIPTLMWTKQPDSHPSETQDGTNSSAPCLQLELSLIWQSLTELPRCDAQVRTLDWFRHTSLKHRLSRRRGGANCTPEWLMSSRVYLHPRKFVKIGDHLVRMLYLTLLRLSWLDCRNKTEISAMMLTFYQSRNVS